MLASQFMAAELYQEGHPPARLDAGRGPGQRKGNAMRPGPLEPDRLTARLVARYPDQGWSLLCNGVVLLDDGDQLLPDGRIVSRSPRVPVLP
jgi:hypothetical protein